MAHSLSARKRVRQNANRRAENRWRKQRFRGAIRTYRLTLQQGTAEEAEQQLRGLTKLLDQVVAKGTIHRNTASRYKSRLAAHLNTKKAAAAA